VPRQGLMGGRATQMLAAKAYDLHNAELQGTGLTINTPETMWNVPLAEARPPRPPRAWWHAVHPWLCSLYETCATVLHRGPL